MADTTIVADNAGAPELVTAPTRCRQITIGEHVPLVNGEPQPPSVAWGYRRPAVDSPRITRRVGETKTFTKTDPAGPYFEPGEPVCYIETLNVASAEFFVEVD